MPEMKTSFFGYQLGYYPMSAELRANYRGTQWAQLQALKPELRANYRGTQWAQLQALKPEFRSCFTFVQYAIRAPDIGPDMSTQIFPELRGLMFETHAKPTFSTKIAQHTSGKETRTSFWQYPTWEFDLMYDYLPNDPLRQQGETDLKTLMGFFMEMQGSFDTFLFKAPDDYTQPLADMLVGDGLSVEFTLFRQMRGFKEPIGYLKQDSLVMNRRVAGETQNIVNSQVTANHHAIVDDIQLAVSQDGVALGRVAGAPALNQYSVNLGTGVFTFNAVQPTNKPILLSYRNVLTDADYLFLPPNTIQMTVAPSVVETIEATYDFYFVCRFMDDQNDFDQFMDKLWEIQQLNLVSVL